MLALLDIVAILYEQCSYCLLNWSEVERRCGSILLATILSPHLSCPPAYCNVRVGAPAIYKFSCQLVRVNTLYCWMPPDGSWHCTRTLLVRVGRRQKFRNKPAHWVYLRPALMSMMSEILPCRDFGRFVSFLATGNIATALRKENSSFSFNDTTHSLRPPRSSTLSSWSPRRISCTNFQFP
jgi:hypothetical protein